MARIDVIGLIRSLIAGSGFNLIDMTPNDAPLNSGNLVGPWRPGCAGGKVGFIHIEADASCSAGAQVYVDCCINQNGPPALGVMASTLLTGPSTGDGYVPLSGAPWYRIRRTDLGAGNVTATASWS